MEQPQIAPIPGNGHNSHEAWIDGAAGRLCRRWERPSTMPAVARMLIFHGYGDHSGRFSHFKRWLADRGVAGDSFDFRGHGRSGGKRGFVRHWDEYLDDVRLVLETCRPIWKAEGLSQMPLFVLGHSHGGLILAAAGIRGILQPGEISGCIMSAPYLVPAEPLTWPWRIFAAVTNVFTPALRVKTGLTPEHMTADPAMLSDSRADMLLLRAATPRWYKTALRTQTDVAARAAEFRLPLLCLIGDHDRIASLEGARQFVEKSGSPDKLFHVIPGARHEILRETMREQTFEQIFQWMRARC
jgi:alpha-beta hydrolase superfamily lysophospholipase